MSPFEQEEGRFEIEVWRFIDVEPQIEPAYRQNKDGLSLDEHEVWLFSIDVRPYELEGCPVVDSETTFELARSCAAAGLRSMEGREVPLLDTRTSVSFLTTIPLTLSGMRAR